MIDLSPYEKLNNSRQLEKGKIYHIVMKFTVRGYFEVFGLGESQISADVRTVFDQYYPNASLEDVQTEGKNPGIAIMFRMPIEENKEIGILGSEIASRLQNQAGNWLPIGIGQINYINSYKVNGFVVGTTNQPPDSDSNPPGTIPDKGLFEDFFKNVLGTNIPPWARVAILLAAAGLLARSLK